MTIEKLHLGRLPDLLLFGGFLEGESLGHRQTAENDRIKVKLASVDVSQVVQYQQEGWLSPV